MSQELDGKEELKKPETQEFDVDAFTARMEKMEASNARLLEESKGWKSKYQDVQSQKEEEHKLKLADNEQWKELDEINKNKIHTLEERIKNKTKSSMQKDLNFKVASLAGDAYDVSDIISNLPKNLLTIDEETESVGGVEEAINYVRENKSHLFKRENKSGQTSGRPNGELPKDKTLEERINENPNSVLNEVLASVLS